MMGFSSGREEEGATTLLAYIWLLCRSTFVDGCNKMINLQVIQLKSSKSMNEVINPRITVILYNIKGVVSGKSGGEGLQV